MRIALVSCGESALESFSPSVQDDYAVTIGINWAVYHWHFDWAAAWDALVWRYADGRFAFWPVDGIVTCGRLPDDVATVAASKALQVESFPRLTSCTTTFPNALEWALLKWPDSEIDIYGLDMNGKQGLQPWHDGRCHSSWRWDVELKHLHSLWSLCGPRLRLVGCNVDESMISDASPSVGSDGYRK